jgi:hypothetical protein
MYDVRPDLPGIEIVLLEESHGGDDRTALVNLGSVLFYASRHGDEPQNAANGEFDNDLSPGTRSEKQMKFA